MLSKPIRTLLLTLLPVLLLVLSACETSATPPALEPTTEATGLEFLVDPKTQEVTVIEPDMDAASIAQLQVEGENRLLVQGEDIRFRNFSFQFNAPNKLVVLLNVENITDDLSFAQPFFFTLNSTSNNIVEAVAPLVTDAQLGGDGVLSPGETSEPFRFEVTFREDEPFAFFVEANALVEAASCSNPVSIPDEQLERAVRDTLDKQEGELTCEDLASLEVLDTIDVGVVTNLEGLQFAVNLRALFFAGDDVSDLTPLANLTNLTTLDLVGNDVSDLTPLANLINLTTLDLAENSFSDLTPLAALANLATLELDFNSISDLSPLENLTDLESLSLVDNGLSDLGPLENLTRVTFFNLSINDISDIGALVNNSGLGEGDTVRLFDNPFSPQALEDIETLEARGVNVAF